METYGDHLSASPHSTFLNPGSHHASQNDANSNGQAQVEDGSWSPYDDEAGFCDSFYLTLSQCTFFRCPTPTISPFSKKLNLLLGYWVLCWVLCVGFFGTFCWAGKKCTRPSRWPPSPGLRRHRGCAPGRPAAFGAAAWPTRPGAAWRLQWRGGKRRCGRGSKPIGSHFGVGAPPILVGILVGIWMFTGRYGILTHGHAIDSGWMNCIVLFLQPSTTVFELDGVACSRHSGWTYVIDLANQAPCWSNMRDSLCRFSIADKLLVAHEGLAILLALHANNCATVWWRQTTSKMSRTR